MASDYLHPEGLPAEVGALMSTRRGGTSAPPFDTMNLRPAGLRGDAVDDARAVLRNQRLFAKALGAAPFWLNQVHGHHVLRLGPEHLALARAQLESDTVPPHDSYPQVDASVTTERGLACTVLVADCLPVLFAAPDGLAVGAAHAGWRGLAGGVLEATLAELCKAASCLPGDVSVWLGACIGPTAFEVGADVLHAFGGDPAASTQAHFKATNGAGDEPKWWADLPGLARQRLQLAGVRHIEGGRWCTVSEPSRFFSFRRDRITGRLAAAIFRR